MKEIKTIDAVGTVLCHDITQIIKGVSKGPVFRKGHIVTEEDIPVLLSVGKETLFVWDDSMEGLMHENDAAEVLCRICGGELDHMRRGEVSEGKIELFADTDGLLKVDRTGLKVLNGFGQMMAATRHGDTAVRRGDKLAGMRIIPLAIEEEKMRAAEEAVMAATGGRPILQIVPFRHKKVGIVTTGNEVYSGRIKDTFTPVIIEKLSGYDVEIVGHDVLDDDDRKVTASIIGMIEKGADFVVCTGGMSVDPDDRTPLAIKNTGAEIISYGAPVLPGAMFLLAYYQAGEGAFGSENAAREAVIAGLPGCVMYAKRTIFDIVLPRIMSDDRIGAGELSSLGEGGLCLNCGTCTFPNCGFGKGR